MIEFKKISTGFFRAYVDGANTDYTIQLASAYGCGAGKVFYDAYKGEDRINSPMIRLTLAKAKTIITTDINKK